MSRQLMMKKNIHYADSKIKTILLQPVNNVSKCQSLQITKRKILFISCNYFEIIEILETLDLFLSIIVGIFLSLSSSLT